MKVCTVKKLHTFITIIPDMIEILQYDFMVRALIAGIIIGILAPSIGLFLVVRRYSLMSDTLAHVSLVGVAAAVIFNINPIIGALITSVVAGFGMELLRERKNIYGESVLAIFLSGSLALAVVLMSLARGLNINFLSYLFGSITTVSTEDVILIGGCGMVVLVSLMLLYNKFFLISYDEELARANGLPVRFLNIVLITIAAVTVSLAMRIVGILLVGALMVIPVVSAVQYGGSFRKIMMVSVMLALVSVVSGLFISFYLNLPSGGSIVLISLLLFIFSIVAGKK